MNKCKFCKKFKEEIKIDKEKGITVQNMYDIMKLSIENLDNADCNIECWLNEDIFLGCDFHISHFNAIPDIVLSFENEEVKKMQEQLSQLQQDKEELVKWLEEVRNKPVAPFPETQEQAEELGKVKFCIEVLERLGVE